ncbi:uncharacterized protein LOC127651425 isoform X5 [Xyrauchen texanus]|uniref:uncharacterized protein LOC127651425 isoform X5 n=1 Tax=Xyrauchen texanus TaxID=154827 RepID=UPI00224244AD|nr:uncharacterized protein LOC127651425 isoform X5 [Xyrauchen texanus]
MMEQNIPIIILSDEDEDDENSMTHNDSSVLIVENEKNGTDTSMHIEELDEDLAITYSQTATVLPHARYDCSLTFSRAEQDVSGPLHENAMHCGQCFCYICDRLASMCEYWTLPGICHCNAHKHSVYWKALRDKSLMGYLHELNFTFDPLDMDSDLRRAETSLQKFAGSLAIKYALFLTGFEKPLRPTNCRCSCHRTNNGTSQSRTAGCKGCQKHHMKLLEYDYTAVSNHIEMFLHEAKKENPKACIVMLLGAIKLFITHTAPGNVHDAVVVSNSVTLLLWRVMTKVWMLLVDFDFSTSFTKQLQSFFQRLPLPSNCTFSKRYRELARYLKVVKSTNNPMLQRMRDLVPLYLCKVGDFSGAVHTMLSSVHSASCPASRLTPQHFRAYLRILTSGHTPDIKHQECDSGTGLMIMPDPLMATVWTPIEGSFVLKILEVLKFALRVLDCNSIVFADSESWVYLLSVISCSYVAPDGLIVGAFYTEPDVNFQTVTRVVANSILGELTTSRRIHIPRTFENDYPDQARLLLVTQALVLRIFHSQLSPILKVIISFRSNRWALRWLFYSLLVRPVVLHYLLCTVVEELLNEQYQPVQRKWSEMEHSLISYFLCLYFLENNVALDLGSYPTNNLLASWNELHFPWQLGLRLHLEYNVASLSKEKRQILHEMQRISLVPTS